MQVDRREFFKLVAAGGAATTLEACAKIVPQPHPRPPLVGAESWVQSVCGACPAACGISVRKIGESSVQIVGVAGHPVSDSGLCPRGIAEIQNLYHSERLRGPVARVGLPHSSEYSEITWDDGLARVADAARSGHVVIGIGDPLPVEAALLGPIAAALDATVVSTRLPHGQPPVEAMRAMLGSGDYVYDLGEADLVVSLGADWLRASPSPVEAWWAFAAIRRRGEGRGRLLTVSPRLSTTAAKSDEWIPVRSDQTAFFGVAVARLLLEGGTVERAQDYPGFEAFAAMAQQDRFSPQEAATRLGIKAEQLESVALELATRERAVVIADRTDLATQYVSVALNLLIGAIGRKGGLIAREPVPLPDALGSTRLAIHSDRFPAVESPVVLLFGANPVGVAVPSSGWSDGLKRASFIASFSPFLDECSKLANIVLPPSTPLESKQLAWGSTQWGRAFVTGGPAVVSRLYETRESTEILLRLAELLGVGLPWTEVDDYLAAIAEPLEASEYLDWGGFGLVGAVPDKIGDVETAGADAGAAAAVAKPSRTMHRFTTDNLPVLGAVPGVASVDFPFVLDAYVTGAYRDGRGAHLPFLHGLTEAFERELWRTVVEVNEKTAHRMSIEDGERVRLISPAGQIEVVARVRQGIRPDTLAVAIGLGRRALGLYAEGHGANPLELGGPTSLTFVRMEKAT